MGLFGKSKEEKKLSELTGGGFERPSTVSSFVKPTAEAVKERVKGGLEKIGEEQRAFSKSRSKQRTKAIKKQAKKGFNLQLSPALRKVNVPKQKKSQMTYSQNKSP